MDSELIHAYKHPKHSRVLEGHDAERIERTEKTINAAKKAIERAGELVHKSEDLLKRARRAAQD